MAIETQNVYAEHITYTEQIVSWWTTTTYVWQCFIYDFNTNISDPDAATIWKIKRITTVVSWWTTTTKIGYPEDADDLADNVNRYVWDDRASYTYSDS